MHCSATFLCCRDYSRSVELAHGSGSWLLIHAQSFSENGDVNCDFCCWFGACLVVSAKTPGLGIIPKKFYYERFRTGMQTSKSRFLWIELWKYRQSSKCIRWGKSTEELWPDSNMWAAWKQPWPIVRKSPWLYLVGGSKHAICNCILAPNRQIRHKCPKSEIIGLRLATARIESTTETDLLRQSELTTRCWLSLEVDSSKVISPFAGRHKMTALATRSASFADGNIEFWVDRGAGQ